MKIENFGQNIYRCLESRVVRHADKVLDKMIDLRANRQVKRQVQQLLPNGIPLAYGPHEGHADGAALAHVSEFLRDLAEGTDGCYPFKGLVAPMAKSWAEGQQGQEHLLSMSLIPQNGKAFFALV